MSNRFFTKILLAFGLLACAATAAYAVRAYPHPIKVTQPDGTTITIQIHGDEFLNWTTAGNRLVEKGPDGFYYYASFNSDGTKSISKNRVSNTLASFAASTSGSTVRPPQTAIAAAQAKRAVARIGNPDLAHGEKHFLVLLVQFPDLSFTVDNPVQAFTNLLNEEGYSVNGGTGSSRDYYMDNSGDQFQPTFDVLGPFTVSGNHLSYGSGQNTSGAGRLLIEALQIADASINYANYDLDGDGIVDNVFMYYAGHNAAEGGSGIWPHKSSISTAYYHYDPMDGKEFDSYACTSEYSGNDYSTTMCGIGTFTHEFGHVIGLPDMYDTDYEQNGYAPGPGVLSLMNNGSYLNEGRTPPYLGGLERAILGWIELTEWKESGNKTLNPIQDNEAYMTPTKNKTESDGPIEGEFYVYEYRNGTGWDRFIGDQGVAIYHVDRRSQYLRYWDITNQVNAFADHECYDLIEANGNTNGNGSYTIAGLLYAGSSGKSEFSSSSSPAALDWDGDVTGYNLTNISHNGTNASLMLTNLAGGTIIDEFLDAGVNAIDRKATYSAGEEFKFQLTVSNNSPVDVVWFFDDVEQDSNVSSINLSAGEHTVVAVLKYSDGSTERITTKLNVQ